MTTCAQCEWKHECFLLKTNASKYYYCKNCGCHEKGCHCAKPDLVHPTNREINFMTSMRIKSARGVRM